MEEEQKAETYTQEALVDREVEAHAPPVAQEIKVVFLLSKDMPVERDLTALQIILLAVVEVQARQVQMLHLQTYPEREARVHQIQFLEARSPTLVVAVREHIKEALPHQEAQGAVEPEARRERLVREETAQPILVAVVAVQVIRVHQLRVEEMADRE